jgi:hypothetical protein
MEAPFPYGFLLMRSIASSKVDTWVIKSTGPKISVLVESASPVMQATENIRVCGHLGCPTDDGRSYPVPIWESFHYRFAPIQQDLSTFIDSSLDQSFDPFLRRGGDDRSSMISVRAQG